MLTFPYHRILAVPLPSRSERTCVVYLKWSSRLPCKSSLHEVLVTMTEDYHAGFHLDTRARRGAGSGLGFGRRPSPRLIQDVAWVYVSLLSADERRVASGQRSGQTPGYGDVHPQHVVRSSRRCVDLGTLSGTITGLISAAPPPSATPGGGEVFRDLRSTPSRRADAPFRSRSLIVGEPSYGYTNCCPHNLIARSAFLRHTPAR